jgi:PKD repeat protein
MIAKRFLMASSVVLLFFLPCGAALGQDLDPGGDTTLSDQEFAPDQLLVRFGRWVTAQRADQVLAERGLSRMRQIHALGVHVLRLPPGLSVERAMQIFSNLPEVEFAEPNYILQVLAFPRAEIGDQWPLVTIQAQAAWAAMPVTSTVPLGIVDTGIDRNHTDLAPNIWQNQLEVDGQPGIDDDGNGYIDDTWGWDFVNNDNDPFDDNMHGTAVSSVAAGARDGAGVAGVCPWCTLIAVKVMGADGSGYLDTVATGITYATDLGAKVINLSLGGIFGSQTLENAVNYAWNKGSLVVAAAGNDGADARLYPAAYTNAMAIASTNKEDYRSCLSNYGAGYISVAAPGESILCATPNQEYGTYSGTSLSTPHVSGLGGLLFSQDSARTNTQVKSLIETTVNDLGPEGADAYFGSGRINALRAVTGDTSSTTPPAGLFSDDLTASGYAHARKLARDSQGILHLVWHGWDGGQYRVLYATSGDGGASWSSPEVVFASSAETYHPALAIGGGNVYVALPSKHGSSRYRVFVTSKALTDDGWPAATPLMGGAYDAVRPDLYYDPNYAPTGKLHLVASSFDNAPFVYYTSSVDGGASWSTARQMNVGYQSRYADVHASGGNVYVAGRTVEFTLFGLLPVFRVFSIRSLDGGDSWADLTELAQHQGLLSGEYGASLAGVEDRLYLAYEHNGAIYFRRSEGGVGWSAATNVGSGAWPSVTQATGGQAWVMWASGGTLSLRHYTGSVWDAAEAVGGGNYPNLKLGTAGGLVEWTATHCSGAPFRLIYDLLSLGPNNQPAAVDDSATTSEDTSVTIDVLANDTDVDEDTLTVLSVTEPITGSATINLDETITYTPDANFSGTDSFTYTISDGNGGTDAATVTIAVNPVNDPPVANDQSVTTPEDTPLDMTLTGSDADGDALTYSVVTGPGHGSLSGTAPDLTYTPDANFNGPDGFTFKVDDGTVDSDPATVSIRVTPVNNPPVANDDSATTPEDTQVIIYVVSNDKDVDDNLDASSANTTCTICADVSHGALINNGNGTFSYRPDADFVGTDSFVYQVCDTGLLCDTATVTVMVTPVSMHVGDLDGSSVSVRNKWTATVTITVHYVDHSPVAGARVSGLWSAGPSDTGWCDTGSEGQCSIVLGGIVKKIPSVIFTVDGVTHGTLTYWPSDNRDPDGDSDGTSITVSREGTNQPPVATFTCTCTDLPCDFDASGSYDPDGTIVSYEWDFGDGDTGSGETTSHTYAADGIYTVTLTVTDDRGATDTDTQPVAVAGAAGTIHISDFTLSGKEAGPNRSATALITIVDASDNPVSGATVYGTWTRDYEASVSGVTGADGTVRFTSGKVRKAPATFTFTVADVFKSGYTYDPSRNTKSSDTVVVP